MKKLFIISINSFLILCLIGCEKSADDTQNNILEISNTQDTVTDDSNIEESDTVEPTASLTIIGNWAVIKVIDQRVTGGTIVENELNYERDNAVIIEFYEDLKFISREHADESTEGTYLIENDTLTLTTITDGEEYVEIHTFTVAVNELIFMLAREEEGLTVTDTFTLVRLAD